MRFRFFRRAALQELRFPIATAERIAVLSPAFEIGRNARHFSTIDAEPIRKYAPQGLVATLRDAIAVAPVDVDDALVILTPHGEAPLSNRDRDHLWRKFKVPVYEQLQAPDHTVIAMECEVHDGLHIVEGTKASIPNGLTGEVISHHCECGLETPRLRNLSRSDPSSVAA